MEKVSSIPPPEIFSPPPQGDAIPPDLKRHSLSLFSLPKDVRSFLIRRLTYGLVLSSLVSLAIAFCFFMLYDWLAFFIKETQAKAIVAALALLFVYYFVIHPRIVFRDLAAYPVGSNLPFIGSIHLIDFDHNALLANISWLGGHVPGIAQAFAGPLDGVVLLSNPNALRVILKEDPYKLPKMTAMKFLLPWLGRGLLTASGDKWKIHRRIITPAFHFAALKSYHSLQVKHLKIFVKKLQGFAAERKSIDLVPHITCFTLDIISEAACGYDAETQIKGESEYAKAVHEACVVSAFHMTDFPFIPPFIWHLTPGGRRFLKSVKTMHRVCEEMIEKKQKERRQRGEAKRDIGGEHWNFLDILLDTAEANDEENYVMTRQDVIDEVNTFIFEGHDTTSVALSWLLFELSRNPEIAKKIREEVNEVLGDKEYPDYDDLKQFRYLDMCIKESLRLHPSVYIIGRSSEETIQLGEYVVPKGAEVALLLYPLHMNPHIWPEPHVFDPERFNAENSANRHPFAYLPFSAGARNCIGQHFALNQLKLASSTLIRKFNFELQNEREVIALPNLVLRMKSGLKVTVSDRKD